MNHLLKLAMVSTLVSGSMIGHAVASEEPKTATDTNPEYPVIPVVAESESTAGSVKQVEQEKDRAETAAGEAKAADRDAQEAEEKTEDSVAESESTAGSVKQQVEQEKDRAKTAAGEAKAADRDAQIAAENAKELAKVAVVNQKVDKVKEKADIAAQAATNATELVVGFANKVITNINDLTKVLEDNAANVDVDKATADAIKTASDNAKDKINDLTKALKANAANVDKVDDIEKLSEDTKKAINLLKITLKGHVTLGEMTSQVAELGNDAEVLAHIAKSANNAMKAAADAQASQTSAERFKKTAEERYKKDLENTIKDNHWTDIAQKSTYYRYTGMLGVDFVQGDSTQLSYKLDVNKDNLYLVYAVCDGGECKTSFALEQAKADQAQDNQDRPVENLLAGDPSFGLYNLKTGSYTIRVTAQCLSEDKLCALSMSYGERKQD